MQGIFGMTNFTVQAHWYPGLALPLLVFTLFVAVLVNKFLQPRQQQQNTRTMKMSNKDIESARNNYGNQKEGSWRNCCMRYFLGRPRMLPQDSTQKEAAHITNPRTLPASSVRSDSLLPKTRSSASYVPAAVPRTGNSRAVAKEHKRRRER